MKLIPSWVWAVMTIRQEADNEPFAGKVAVAEVIRNRTKNKYQSDGTIESTVLRAQQFSGWNTNDPNRIRIAGLDIEDPRTIDAINAYKMAFEKNSDTVNGANLYHADYVSPSWAPRVQIITRIGKHIFYKE